MPIHPPPGLRRLPDKLFNEIVYQTMEVVFSVHNELGILFDESVYEKVIRARVENARTEVQFEVAFETFRKNYKLDLLVADGAVFELKTVDCLNDRHRAQLLNYLLLLELPHGKLVNLQGDSVQHEFVNAPLTREERTCFDIDDTGFYVLGSTDRVFKHRLIALLRDLGTCLEISLYVDAVVHLLGGQEKATGKVPIVGFGAEAGHQHLPLLSNDVSFCITGLNRGEDCYEGQLRRFLRHMNLLAIQWANVGRRQVVFKTLRK